MLKKIFVILIVLTGCIDPISFRYKGQTEHLVVQSEFTDQPGLQYVLLTRSSAFDFPFNQFEEFATVYVSSDKGENIDFQYSGHGYYYPDSTVAGKIGNTYTLHIITADDRSYQSQPVMLLPSIPIDTAYYEYAETLAVIKGNKEKVLSPGYYIYLNYKDPSESGNYFRWSYHLEFEVRTHPEDFIDRDCCRFPTRRPKKCCSHCWVSENLENFVVNDDRLTNGQEVIGQEALFIPYYEYLNFKCKVSIYQHTVSQEEFQFYRSLYNQNESNGGILDPPPSEIKGNISSVQNPNEKVIGFFNASGVSSYQITLLGSDFPGPKTTFEWDDDCRTLNNSTTDEPANW